MRKFLLLSSLLLLQTIASAAPNLIFISTGTTNLVVAKDQKIVIVQNNLYLDKIAVTHSGQTYSLQYGNTSSGGTAPTLDPGDEIVGPVTLTLDSGGERRWIAYETLPTQSEVVVIAGSFPNSATLPDSSIYRQRINFRKNGTYFVWDCFKIIDSQSRLVGGSQHISDNLPLLSITQKNFDYLGPATLVRNSGGWTSTSWAVIVFEKIPYNPPGTQSATVQIQFSPDLNSWTNLTTISVQTNRPNNFLRFKIE
jgi:hypothetical protein